MTRTARILWLLPVGLALLAASPASWPDDLARQGNEAFARGEFNKALDLYTRAEERTTDPGLIAFDKAAALYQLGRYRDAELHYRRCREDATGFRRARLLYGLGNCLVQQAQGTDAALLDQAIDFYEECLRETDAETTLLADARHNLELAKLLRLQAKPSKEGRNPPESDRNPEAPPPDRKGPDAQQGDDSDPSARKQGVMGEQAPGEKGDPRAKPTPTDQPPPPGKGNLPPLPDDDELTKLAPEDAREHLRRAAQRIARDQQEHRQRSASAPSRTALDW
jgi:tetratricopeptide (TPR) repeat protein